MYGDNSTPIFPTEDALTMIRLALAEDVRTGDVTSEWTIPADQKQHARLIAKEDGVLAGLPVIEQGKREGDAPQERRRCREEG